MQTTLILLKPDCITGRKAGEVLKRFEDAGFQIRGCKMFRADVSLLQEAIHRERMVMRNNFSGPMQASADKNAALGRCRTIEVIMISKYVGGVLLSQGAPTLTLCLAARGRPHI